MENLKFLVDENLLGLLKKLRMMGLDSISLIGASDDLVTETAAKEHRIVLTKDLMFFNKLSSGSAYFVKSEIPKDQLLEVLLTFPSWRSAEPLSRCTVCNALIRKVDKTSIKSRIDQKTYNLYNIFYECPGCHRIYWEGSHYDKLQGEIKNIVDKMQPS